MRKLAKYRTGQVAIPDRVRMKLMANQNISHYQKHLLREYWREGPDQCPLWLALSGNVDDCRMLGRKSNRCRNSDKRALFDLCILSARARVELLLSEAAPESLLDILLPIRNFLLGGAEDILKSSYALNGELFVRYFLEQLYFEKMDMGYRQFQSTPEYGMIRDLVKRLLRKPPRQNRWFQALPPKPSA